MIILYSAERNPTEYHTFSITGDRRPFFVENGERYGNKFPQRQDSKSPRIFHLRYSRNRHGPFLKAYPLTRENVSYAHF